jgi:hypothetical protein
VGRYPWHVSWVGAGHLRDIYRHECFYRLVFDHPPDLGMHLILESTQKRSLEDLEEMAKMIGGFVLLVLVVTAIHSFIALPLIYAGRCHD